MRVSQTGSGLKTFFPYLHHCFLLWENSKYLDAFMFLLKGGKWYQCCCSEMDTLGIVLEIIGN